MKDMDSVYNLYFNDKDAIIFDLDGTLYDEWDYLSQAYKAISEDIKVNFHKNEDEVFQFIISEFQKKGRIKLLSKVIDKFELPVGYLAKTKHILRNLKVKESITCYKQIPGLLKLLQEKNKQLYIITNGNVIQQKNKISILQSQNLLKEIYIVYADEHIPKPDPAAFNYLMQRFNLKKDSSIMIGDTDTDRDFAQLSGIEFIHIKEIIT